MIVPFYVRISETKDKRPKKGEKITHKNFDLFRGYITKDGGVKNEYRPKEVYTKDFIEFIASVLNQNIEKKLEEAGVDDEVKKIEEESKKEEKEYLYTDKFSRQIVSRLMIDVNENDNLILTELNICNDYLPNDDDAPQRIAEIAKELVSVVNNYHKVINATRQETLFISCLGFKRKAGTNKEEAYSVDNIELFLKKDGLISNEPYTAEKMPVELVTKALFELNFKSGAELEYEISKEKEVNFTGKYFNNPVLKAKNEKNLTILTGFLGKEAEMVAKEIMSFFPSVNLFAK